MSGGALDYLYQRINDAADTLCTYRHMEYVALADHMRKLATVLREVEWVMSGDESYPRDIEAIANVISPADILDVAIQRANRAKLDLDGAIEFAYSREGKGERGCLDIK